MASRLNSKVVTYTLPNVTVTKNDQVISDQAQNVS